MHIQKYAIIHYLYIFNIAILKEFILKSIYF